MEEVLHHLAGVSTRQQQCFEQLVAQQERAEQEIEQFRDTAQRIPLPEPRAVASQLLTKLTEQADVKAYLHTFEVVATREAWDKESCVRTIALFLSGKAQPANYTLSATQCDNYDALKAEILVRG